MAGRGSLGLPGTDLARLPVALDPRGLSLAEGVRAAFAFGLVVLVEAWVQWPPLLTMALAANLACFCDTGGPVRARLRVLAAFSLLGGLVWGGFGLIRPLGLPVVVPLACALIFACAYARVWSLRAQAAGNVLVVVLCIGLDRPLTLGQAATTALLFAAGGLWATVLALAIWRLHPYRPAQRSVAEVWYGLARLCGDLERLACTPGTDAAAFDGHARAHRRGVRAAIEAARATILDLARARERVSERTAQALLRLESAEQIFSGLIALSEIVESAGEPRARAEAGLFLRRLRPLLAAIARAIRDDRPLDLARLEPGIARAADGLEPDSTPGRLARRMLDRVRVGAKLSAPDGWRPGGALAGEPPLSRRARLLGPLAANLTRESPNLRHAVRAAVVSAPALAATLVWSGAFTHWLVMTVVLTMQPFYATTWQRALERIGGTVLGGLVGAVLAQLVTAPLAQAALIVPLSILGFAARQVSYGVFIACLTPLLVLLIEVIEPGHASWEIVGERAGFTLLGGLIAVGSALVLWPVWEPDQVRRELRRALAAHAALARTVLVAPPEGRDAALTAGARAAGLALADLEAALSRALQQPRAGRHPEVAAALVADAALRRISARLTVLRHAGRLEPAGAGDAWETWAADALTRLAAGEALPERPGVPQPARLLRLLGQVELLAGTLRPGETRAEAVGAPADGAAPVSSAPADPPR